MEKRIIIIGPPGSGKTIFSLKLAQTIKVPVHHLDRLLFLPGGVKRNLDEFASLQKELIKENEWIIEGCGVRSFEVRLSRATIIISLETSSLLCVWRALYRSIFERKKLPDTPEGCGKVFNFKLIKYIWSFKNIFQSKLVDSQEKYPDVLIYKAKNQKQLKQVIQEINRR